MTARLYFGVFFVLPFLLAGCDTSETPTATYQPEVVEPPKLVIERVYKFAVVPEGSQMRIPEVYGPIVDYLNAHLDAAKLVLVAPKSHAELEAGLRNKAFEMALANAFQVVTSTENGYHVIAKKGDDDLFYGIFIVRRDSGINSVRDLKGRKVCYPSPSGVAATMLPMVFLKSQGIDVFKDLENLYVGSHESSMMHVYLGQAAAGTAREFSWNAFQKTHPMEAAALEVKWRTDPLIDQAVVAHNDVPHALTVRIADLLTDLHHTAEGQAILMAMSASRFEPANDATYDKARRFFMDNPDLIPLPAQQP